MQVLAPLKTEVDGSPQKRSPERLSSDGESKSGLSTALSGAWGLASKSTSWLSTLAAQHMSTLSEWQFIRTDKLIEYARGGVHSNLYPKTEEETAREGDEAEQVRHRSAAPPTLGAGRQQRAPRASPAPPAPLGSNSPANRLATPLTPAPPWLVLAGSPLIGARGAPKLGPRNVGRPVCSPGNPPVWAPPRAPPLPFLAPKFKSRPSTASAQGERRGSIVSDIVSYLKPASASEIRYVRMLSDLCCLTYQVSGEDSGLLWRPTVPRPLSVAGAAAPPPSTRQGCQPKGGGVDLWAQCPSAHPEPAPPRPQFDKLTPSVLSRLHRLVLVTTSRACTLPLTQPHESAEGLFDVGDGMGDVPRGASPPPAEEMDAETAYALERIAQASRSASALEEDPSFSPAVAHRQQVGAKLREAAAVADAAASAGVPLTHRLLGSAGSAGSALRSTVAGMLEGTAHAGFLAWQRQRDMLGRVVGREGEAGAGRRGRGGSDGSGSSDEAEAGRHHGGQLPVDWYVADDPLSGIRYVVIQGSESLESWVTNLTFEPTAFEDPALNVTVHRGVYEVAQQMYDRLLPLVEEHLGRSPFAKVSFTGHSLGGAIAVALMMMFRHRRVLPTWAMAPCYTFGVASAFWDANECSATGCHAAHHGEGCDAPDTTSHHGSVLERFGLPEDMVRNVILHRDVVPRAFTCDYTPVADFMRSWGPTYRNHGPLFKGSPVSGKVMMYSHVGKMYALQPDEGQRYVQGEGYHPLLPEGAGLWSFGPPTPTSRVNARRFALDVRSRAVERGEPEPYVRDPGSLREAFMAFMDTPHPLEILAGPAYGDDGSISRYHNPDHYKKALGNAYNSQRASLEKRLDLKVETRWKPARGTGLTAARDPVEAGPSAGAGGGRPESPAPVIPRTAHVVTTMRNHIRPRERRGSLGDGGEGRVRA